MTFYMYIILCRLNPEAAALIQGGRFIEGFNAISWTSDAVQDLESTILTGPTAAFCTSATPEVDCLVV